MLFKTSKAQGTKDPKEVANTLALDNIEKLVLQQTNEFLYHMLQSTFRKKVRHRQMKITINSHLALLWSKVDTFQAARIIFEFAFVIGILIFF